MMTIRPPVKWHGGKHYLAKRIVELFPDHHTYVEPYGGCASVLMNKPPSLVEVYNDLDENIYNLFHVLKCRGNDLRDALSVTPYSEQCFEESCRCVAQEPLQKAVAFFVRMRQSFGGQGKTFCPTLHRVRRGMADNVSGWLSSIDENLPLVFKRLRTVQVLNRDALDVIRKWDSPDTLFYCDPPYLHETRASTDVYGCEMSLEDHRKMLAALSVAKGRVILSGYPSRLYDHLTRYIAPWRSITFDMPNNAAGGKTKARKTETLWMNF